MKTVGVSLSWITSFVSQEKKFVLCFMKMSPPQVKPVCMSMCVSVSHVCRVQRTNCLREKTMYHVFLFKTGVD